MMLALVLYTVGAAGFYAWLTRSAVLMEEPYAVGTHPVRPTETIELFPAEQIQRAA